MPFLRVRSANRADPQHVFDVSVDQAEAEPELYVVVDREPSPFARPVEYSEPKKPAPKSVKPARKPAVKSPPAPPAEGDKPGEPEKEKA